MDENLFSSLALYILTFFNLFMKNSLAFVQNKRMKSIRKAIPQTTPMSIVKEAFDMKR